MTLKEFGTQRVQQLAKAIVVNAGLAQKAVAIQVLTNVVQATPVDTGRARSNWLVGVGEPDTSTRDTLAQGSKGSSAVEVTQQVIQEGSAALNQGTAPTLYISNNLPYIVPLNQGTSKQAPAGFVEAAVIAAQRAIERIKLLAGT